jgi:hypothetical protein
MNLLRSNKSIKRIEGNSTKESLPLHLKNGARIEKQYKICTKAVYD